MVSPTVLMPWLAMNKHGLVADHLRQARAFGRIERRTGVFVVIGDLAGHPDFGLADLLDAWILEPGQRARIGHVGVENTALACGKRFMNRCVDAIAGALDVALATLDRAVVDADFHKARRRHFRPMRAERNLVIAIAAAGDHIGQMIEDAFARSPG